MPVFEQLQPRRSRSRVDTVPSTFPTGYQRGHGDPGDDVDELLDAITEVVAHHEHLSEEAHRHLGHLGVAAGKAE